MNYEISVRLVPKEVNGKPMYFYCVFANGVNTGMRGWCETPERAFTTGLKDYKQFIIGKQINRK